MKMLGNTVLGSCFPWHTNRLQLKPHFPGCANNQVPITVPDTQVLTKPLKNEWMNEIRLLIYILRAAILFFHSTYHKLQPFPFTGMTGTPPPDHDFCLFLPCPSARQVPCPVGVREVHAQQCVKERVCSVSRQCYTRYKMHTFCTLTVIHLLSCGLGKM